MGLISGKIRRVLYTILGTLFLGIGCVGIIIPILPTTPFLLLAAACYLRGSERMHRWMMSNRVFGEFVRNYLERRGVKLRQKVLALTLLWSVITITILYMTENTGIRILLSIIAVAVSVHIFKLPTLAGDS